MNNTKKLPQRLIVYLIGLLFIAFGVSISINSELGVSPASSLPFVLTKIIDIPMSIVVPIVYGVLILLQIIILKRDYKIVNLSQIVFSFVFGFFVDFTGMIIGDFAIPTYFGRLIMTVASVFLVAVGVSLYVSARLLPMPVEGLAAAITQKKPNIPFHKAKMYVDVTSVLVATILSLILLKGLIGVREGTFISAIFVGKCIPYVQKITSPITKKYCE